MPPLTVVLLSLACLIGIPTATIWFLNTLSRSAYRRGFEDGQRGWEKRP
jgi:hypothetical protein